MDVFPPAYTDYLTEQFSFDDENRVESSEFGDGYKQVSGVGINSQPGVFRLNFEGLNEAQFTNLRTWLKDHPTQRFLWTPPLPGAAQGIYRRDGKLASARNLPLFRLTVTFKEEF